MGDIHLGGLVSGMDIQTLVDKLLEIRRAPIERMEDNKLDIEADIAAWSDANTYMTALTDSLDTLRDWDIWNKMLAESSDETKLTASASTAAAAATYSINITHLAQAHSVSSDRAADLTLNPAHTSATDLVAEGILTAGHQFVIEGQTFTIDATESLDSLKNKINLASDSMAEADRVYAAIIDNRLVITRLNTGATDITMSDSGVDTALQDLNILDGLGAYVNELVVAQDASFTVNGASVTRSDNTGLTDVIEGVTLNLLGATASAVTLTVGNDTASVKTAILDFVEAYNAASAVLTAYGQITLGGSTLSATGAIVEGKGELYDDSLVRTILSNIRKYAADDKYPYLNPINASYTYDGDTATCSNLSHIGIWTVSKDNMLQVTDEDKLDYMLGNYFETVEQLFRGVYDATEGYTHGVASDFYEYSDAVSTSMTGAIYQRTTRLNQQITDIDKNIAKTESDIASYETYLWQQFAAMESAIANMQKELSWLTSQLNVG